MSDALYEVLRFFGGVFIAWAVGAILYCGWLYWRQASTRHPDDETYPGHVPPRPLPRPREDE